MTSESTPGLRESQQESSLLTSERNEKAPLSRDSSVIQQVFNFIGISEDNEETSGEKAKWDTKRIRRIYKRYNLNNSELEKFARIRSTTSLSESGPPLERAPSPVAACSSLEDVEKGIAGERVLGSATIGKSSVVSTPSPSYESASSSFDGIGKEQKNSFPQTADMSQSKLRPSIISQQQQESVSSAVMSSMSNLFKKGSLINKKRLRLQSSFSSKRSFDLDMGPESIPELNHSFDEDADYETPSSDTILKPHADGDCIEMQTLSKSRIVSPPEKEIITSGIPEETSFEVEVEEMGDIDEAQGGEMVSDPTAMSRMTAKVRKKSSFLAPPRVMSDTSSQCDSSSLIDRFKTKAIVERPTDLNKETIPIIHPSSSLTGRVSFQKHREAKSSEMNEILEILAEKSDNKYREDEINEPCSSLRAGSRMLSYIPVQRTISVVDEIFFDPLPIHSQVNPPEHLEPAEMTAPELDAYHPDIAQSPPTSAKLKSSGITPYTFDTENASVVPEVAACQQSSNISYIDLGDSMLNRPTPTVLGGKEGLAASRQPDRVLTENSSKHQKQKRDLTYKFTKQITSHQRRQRGIGVFGKFFERSYKDDLSPMAKKMLAEGSDEKQWFTFWVTTVQTLVCLLSVSLYGFAPYGLATTTYQGDVLDTTLSNRRVSYMEQDNIWIGPYYSDLIKLGAVYSPCMRREIELWKVIEEDRRAENMTGCCIANDHSCYQSSESICPRKVARWVRWDKPITPAAYKQNFLIHKSKSDSDLLRKHNLKHAENGSTSKSWIQQRTSGAVCGQDPSYCDFPRSVAPYEWPDDITQWPICQKKHEGAGLPEHVTCQVTGRPCCIQYQGLCRIATKEYCDFLRGHWHENATLCSQVNCFADVCGMSPFFFGDNPNQFYRVFSSLFVHAGILHLACTLFFQLYIMKDMEKLIASKRIAILYFASGVAGNLASAIFVPYNPAVGPSSAQCGILAAEVVDCIHHRRIIKDFKIAIFQHVFVIFIVLFIGLIPWVDNWAHLFGFVVGLLTTIIIFPYIDFPDDDKKNMSPQCSAAAPTTSMAHDSVYATNAVETPTATSQRYSQLADGSGSPIEQRNTIVQMVQSMWIFVKNKFKNKRTFYVLISCVVLFLLFFFLAVIFFGNVQFECSWCIYFNCIPTFPCHNKGQKLKKWLPI